MSDNKQMVERIRTTFADMALKESNKFHEKDVEKVKGNDWSIERFILITKTEEEALKALVKCMEWRKSFGVNDFTEEHFPQELYKIGMYNTQLKDKEGRPIIWNRIGLYRKSDLSHTVKQYLIYLIEKFDSQTSYEGWATVVDSTGSGLSNVDMDFVKFLIEVLQFYYPRGQKYIAVVDLPWILNATSKLIVSFMSEELKTRMKFIKKEELTQYMECQCIPVHLKGSYDKDLVVIPEGVKTLEQLSHTKLSADQIKKIHSIFKSELK